MPRSHPGHTNALRIVQHNPFFKVSAMTTATIVTLRCMIIIAASLILFGAIAQAQISVYPTRVMLAARERSREVTVENPTDKSLDVTASFGFQLIRSDSNGTISLDSVIHAPEEKAKSCREWLKIF